MDKNAILISWSDSLGGEIFINGRLLKGVENVVVKNTCSFSYNNMVVDVDFIDNHGKISGFLSDKEVEKLKIKEKTSLFTKIKDFF